MIYLFTISYIILATINKRLLDTRLNSFNLIFTPYVFIMLFNNIVMRTSFLPITSDAVVVMFIGMLFYEIGMMLFYVLSGKTLLSSSRTMVEDFGKVEFNQVNYRMISRFVTIVIILRLGITAYLYFRGGLNAIAGNDYEGMELDPITGRLVICLFPAGWLIAYRLFANEGITRRDKRNSAILCAGILGIQFLGAVKAHAMIYAVGVFLIAVYCNRKNIFRGFLILFGIVFLMFFGNYALSWLTIDSTIPTMQYTMNHFWKYIAGGTINLGGMLSDGSTTYNFFDFWIAILFAIPNEFLSLIGQKISGGGTIPYISVFPRVSNLLGYYYERSNVVNLFGRMYGSGNVIGYFISVVVFALISEWAMMTFRTNSNPRKFMISIVLLSYEIVSFFAFYYSSTHFWQMLIYAGIFTWAAQVKWKLSR